MKRLYILCIRVASFIIATPLWRYFLVGHVIILGIFAIIALGEEEENTYRTKSVAETKSSSWRGEFERVVGKPLT